MTGDIWNILKMKWKFQNINIILNAIKNIQDVNDRTFKWFYIFVKEIFTKWKQLQRHKLMDVSERWCSRFYGIEDDGKMFLDDLPSTGFIRAVFDLKHTVC